MNQLVSNKISQAPIAFATSCEYAGHVAKIEDYKSFEVFCEKFYNIGKFVCLEGTKLKRTTESNIEQYHFLVYESESYTNHKILSIHIRNHQRKRVDYFYLIDTKTIQEEMFKQANSFKEVKEFDKWINTTKEEAIKESNELEEKNNEKNKERNKEVIKDASNYLYDHLVIRYGYLKKEEMLFPLRDSKKEKKREKIEKQFKEKHSIESLGLRKIIEDKIKKILDINRNSGSIDLDDILEKLNNEK